MRNEDLVKSYTPGAAVAAHRICKIGAADGTAIQAAAATDVAIGIANQYGAEATDDTVDVVHAGIANVEYGGTVARGAYLTADANGKAIATTTAGNHVIGIAMVSGVNGQIGSCLIAISRY